MKKFVTKFHEFWTCILKAIDFKMGCPILVIKTDIVPIVTRNWPKEKF